MTKEEFQLILYQATIVFLVILVVMLSIALALTIQEARTPHCYRLLIICNRLVISDDQCVCDHWDTEEGVESTRCDGAPGEPWRFIQGDCYAAMGEECQ